MQFRVLCNALLLACAMLGLGGCASIRKPLPPGESSQPTPEQRSWWEANRHRAQYVRGRGYYVEGVSGFFDERGKPLSSSLTSGGFADEEGEGMDMAKAFSPTENYKRLKAAVGQGPDEKKARAAFDEGEVLFRQDKFKAASSKYAIAYDRWPDSPLEEEALFKAGECEFFIDEYADADDLYARLIKKFPATPHLDHVVQRRFAIARYWEQSHAASPHYPFTPNVIDKTKPKFDTMGHALRVYERVRLDDPTGPLADDSIMATANAYFVQGRYEDADYYYGLLRNEYSKSEHQFQAHVLGLRAKLLKYQGPDYEGTPLKEAEELIGQLLTQFPRELGDERERMVKAKASIRDQMAMRDYNVAEFYAKGQYYGAARVYYEGVAKNYPETKVAREALAKLDEIKGQPADPTPTFKWLEEVFPESKKNGPVIATKPRGVTR